MASRSKDSDSTNSKTSRNSKGVPKNIDIGSSSNSNSSANTATTEGKTPTQEMHRFNISATNETISSRRGSDSLSISHTAPGVITSAPNNSEAVMLPRSKASNLANSSSVSTPNAASTPKPDSVSVNALGLGLGAKRPSPTPVPVTTNTGINKATAVDDGDSDEDGDDEGEVKGGKAAAAAPAQQQQQQQQQHHHQSHNNGHHQHHAHTAGQQHHPHQQHPNYNRSYMDVPAHERGRTGNGHDLELGGVQPMRPRQHQRTSTASSIASSSRKERDHLKPFPTPGMKTPAPHAHNQKNGHHGTAHDDEKDPFDEIRSIEECRLMEAHDKKKHWKKWGPYLSERQWVS
jgi:hypothetical protein